MICTYIYIYFCGCNTKSQPISDLADGSARQDCLSRDVSQIPSLKIIVLCSKPFLMLQVLLGRLLHTCSTSVEAGPDKREFDVC